LKPPEQRWGETISQRQNKNKRTEVMAKVVEFLPTMHKTLVLIPRTTRGGRKTKGNR
jgi:hypothetical protein